MAAPAPAKPAQVAMARVRSSGGKTAVMSDNVAGITKAEPTPMIPRPTMTWAGRGGEPGDEQPDGEHAEAAEEGPLAPEAVAERPGRQQQAGEHEGVGVDDPVELGGGGPQVLLEAGAPPR